MSSQIPRLRIPFYEDQAQRAAEAIRQGQLAQGPHLDELRERLARSFGKRFVTLTANGFSAIFAALKAVGTGTSAVRTAAASTCHAVTNAILASGHALELVDVEPERASLPYCSAGALSVVPDHFGLVADACRDWRAEQGCLIEDASQSFLSRAAAHNRADIVTLSFYPTKLVNGIDGGALLTDDESIHRRAQRLVQYTDQFESEPEARFNLRMNNVNAAVALASLDHLEEVAARLRQVYQAYAGACDARGITYLRTRGDEVASRFVVVERSPEARERGLAALRAAGAQGARELLLLCPPAEAARYAVSRALVDCSYSIPFHPLLSDSDVERVCQSLGRT